MKTFGTNIVSFFLLLKTITAAYSPAKISLRQALAHPVASAKYKLNSMAHSKAVEGSYQQKAAENAMIRISPTLTKQNWVTKSIDKVTIDLPSKFGQKWKDWRAGAPARQQTKTDASTYSNLKQKSIYLERQVAKNLPITQSEAALYKSLTGKDYANVKGTGINYDQYANFLGKYGGSSGTQTALKTFSDNKLLTKYKVDFAKLDAKAREGKINPLEADYLVRLNRFLNTKTNLPDISVFKGSGAVVNPIQKWQYNRKSAALEKSGKRLTEIVNSRSIFPPSQIVQPIAPPSQILYPKSQIVQPIAPKSQILQPIAPPSQILQSIPISV